MNLKKLRKTANHLKFMRYVQKNVGNGGAGVRLITINGEKYINSVEIDQIIQSCVYRLRKGLQDERRIQEK